jgi:hypothetical protein
MRINVKYRDLSAQEAYDMEQLLYEELRHLDKNHIIKLLFEKALWDYKIGKWRYDGPTFAKAPKGFWEVAAFIHDWRNSIGYVGYYIDNEMFDIMIYLNYPLFSVIQRYLLTRFTFLNMFRHWIKRRLKKLKPTLIFKL